MKNNFINIDVGNNLRKARKAAGYNQEQLASGLGLTRTSVCNIEVGRQSLTVESLLKACAILKCKPIDILPGIPKTTIKEINKVVKVKELLSKKLDVNFKW